ncbi:MAG: secondary thiamine-phosphate synthase enzyme YjbQ [Planctomycetota bacterium]
MLFRSLDIRTRSRCEFIDVTEDVGRVVRESGVPEGLCVCFVPHTTAGVTINENADPSVRADVQSVLAKLAPAGADYSHDEGNSDSHVKASLMGSSVVVTIREGSLVLGTWQGVYFCEFDGPRSRQFHVTIMGNPV